MPKFTASRIEIGKYTDFGATVSSVTDSQSYFGLMAEIQMMS